MCVAKLGLGWVFLAFMYCICYTLCRMFHLLSDVTTRGNRYLLCMPRVGVCLYWIDSDVFIERVSGLVLYAVF